MEQNRQEIEQNRRTKLNLHMVNLLRKLLEKVLSLRQIDMPEGDNDPMHGRYAQAVKLVAKDKWEQDTKLPIKYWKILQDLPKVSISPT